VHAAGLRANVTRFDLTLLPASGFMMRNNRAIDFHTAWAASRAISCRLAAAIAADPAHAGWRRRAKMIDCGGVAQVDRATAF
jgi:hypothetical protein